MDLQLTMTLVAVVLAAGYLANRAWKTWKGRKQGCSGGCHSKAESSSNLGKKTVLIPEEDLKLRRK